jgi:hypothetical protein
MYIHPSRHTYISIHKDKHGEDTQGEGRIMLFGLDYALFQDAVTVVAEGENKEGDIGPSEEVTHML